MAEGRPVGTMFAEISLDSTKLEQGLKRVHTSLTNNTIKVEDAYKQLGIKSDAVYAMMKSNAVSALDFIKNKTLSSKEEIMRAEQAAASKIAKINAEQYGKQNELIGRTSSGFMTLQKNMLMAAGTVYLITNAVRGLANMFEGGMEIVDRYNLSITKMAAMMTGMMKEDNRSLADRYKQAYQYAGQLNAMIEQVDKNTLLNAEDLRSVTEEMMKQGVVVDTSSKKQIEAFTQISNALAVVSVGYPNKEIQLRQEIRALLTGETRQTDQLSKMLQAQVGDLKKEIAYHKEKGDLLEWLSKQLVGFAAAQGDINASWEAMKTSLETIGEKILRQGFNDAFKDILDGTQKLSEWAEKHKDEIAAVLQAGWRELRDILKFISTITMPVWWPIGKVAQAVAEDEKVTKAENIKNLLRYREALASSGRMGPGVTAELESLDVLIARAQATNVSEYDALRMGGMPSLKGSAETDEQRKAAEKLANVYRTLYAEQEKNEPQISKYRKELVEIEAKYTDVVAEHKNIDKAWMNQWKEYREWQVEQDWQADLAKMANEGIAKEQKMFNDLALMRIKHDNEIFGLERDNEIRIAELKSSWGEISERKLLEMRRDATVKGLEMRRQEIDAQLEQMGNEAGYAINTKETAALALEKLKIEKQIQVTKEYTATQIAEKERRAYLGTLELLKQVYTEIPGMAEQSYAVELAILNKKRNDYINLYEYDQIAVDRWYYNELEKLQINNARKSQSIMAGTSAAIKQIYRDQLTWGEAGYKFTINTYQDMADSFSDIFADGMKGELKDLSDYWDSFWNSMLNSFAKIMGQMAAQWVMFKAASMMGFDVGGSGGMSMGSGGSNNGLFGMVSNAFGWISGNGGMNSSYADYLANLSNSEASAWGYEGGTTGSSIMSAWGQGGGSSSMLGSWGPWMALPMMAYYMAKGLFSLVGVDDPWGMMLDWGGTMGDWLWGGITGVADVASDVGDWVSDVFDWHTGKASGQHYGSRHPVPVPASAFYAAPAFGSGKSGEFPAFVREDEWILRPQHITMLADELAAKVGAVGGTRRIVLELNGREIGEAVVDDDRNVSDLRAKLSKFDRRRY